MSNDVILIDTEYGPCHDPSCECVQCLEPDYIDPADLDENAEFERVID